MKKYLFMMIAFILFLSMTPEKSKAATVYWDGVELKKGQIGRVTITKPVNLWKRTESGLQFERLLQEGERFRVYRMDDLYGGQFGVGGNYYITNMSDYVIYETPSVSKRKLLDCDQNCLVEMMLILPQEKYDVDNTNEIKERLKSLPESLLVEIINHKIQLILVNGPITGVEEFSYLKGAVPRGWEGTNKTWDDVPGIGGSKSVVVRIGYSEKGKGHGSVNLELHELAHSIDGIIKNHVSTSAAFQTIWNSEKEKLFSGESYFLRYSEEYFAEAFALYYRDQESRNRLKKLAPLTYQFIESIK
ncbi:anthrax toxin lethal factor-related metalloendopeptidase [Bacillus sp. Bva_UNVM-123]|uniref:anthrax toxin lethal factor-related metalloendopeptidase n=1 Tax=Bacillus sp. Bva_UNVM-123 TaxID=2829798 RepID=UPI00391F0E93